MMSKGHLHFANSFPGGEQLDSYGVTSGTEKRNICTYTLHKGEKDGSKNMIRRVTLDDVRFLSIR